MSNTNLSSKEASAQAPKSKTQDKTENKRELSARRAELAAMHTRPALSVSEYTALSQELGRLFGL